MKIKCVFGDNFFDITNKQIELVGQGIAKGKKQLMIVPDRYSLTMERMVLEKLKIKASFDIDVVSFARLASKVLSRVQAPQILSSLGATMVIEMLLTTHEKELSCFKNTAKTFKKQLTSGGKFNIMVKLCNRVDTESYLISL